jgi:hypothetical protein
VKVKGFMQFDKVERLLNMAPDLPQMYSVRFVDKESTHTVFETKYFDANTFRIYCNAEIALKISANASNLKTGVGTILNFKVTANNAAVIYRIDLYEPEYGDLIDKGDKLKYIGDVVKISILENGEMVDHRK